MRRTGRRYKEVIRERVISVRLNEEEFLRLRANAIGGRTSVSRMARERLADLIGGAAVAAASQATVDA